MDVSFNPIRCPREMFSSTKSTTASIRYTGFGLGETRIEWVNEWMNGEQRVKGVHLSSLFDHILTGIPEFPPLTPEAHSTPIRTPMRQSPSSVIISEDGEISTAPVPHMNDQGLRATFHRVRVLGGTLVIVTIIASTMLLLRGEGVTLRTFPEDAMSDQELKRLLDHYNSVSGSIGSFVAKPVELFLGLLMSVAYLCVVTKFTLACNGSLGHWQYLPLLTGAALAYLFSNGLNFLNVQLTPGPLRPRITAEDLAFTSVKDDQPVLENGSLTTTWDRKFRDTTTRNPVLNTILRSKLLSLRNVKSQCNGTGYDDVSEPLDAVPLVTFGFQSQPWQMETLATALDPTGSLKIPMHIKTMNKLQNGNAVMPFSTDVASNLVVVSISALSDLSLENIGNGSYLPALPNGVEGAANFLNLTSPASASLASTSKRFLNASHALWLRALGLATNVTVDTSSVEYTHHNISEGGSNITFDAVTLEFSIPKRQYDTFGNDLNRSDSAKVIVEDYCSRDACLLPATFVRIRFKEATIQPRVQVASVCVNDDGSEAVTYRCSQTSNSSMFIVSIGMRIDEDLWDKEEFPNEEMILFKNLRTVYSITAGRLSWDTEDLAHAFDAECESIGGCEGLRFKMQPGSQSSDFLVVGKNSLPLADLNVFRSSKWRYLVSGADGLGKQGYEVLHPRRFSNVTANGSSLRTTPNAKCNTYAEDFINMVEKNHLYMEHSLQTSYTAAFYFLFQNAVRQKSLSSNSNISTSGTGATESSLSASLAFTGNSQIMNVQVSIPNANAIVSLLGCVLLLLTNFAIALLARRSEHLIQERANAEIVTEAMMNSTKYPSWLLKMALEQQVVAPQDNPQSPLQDLRVQSVLLQPSEGHKHVFHVGSEM